MFAYSESYLTYLVHFDFPIAGRDVEAQWLLNRMDLKPRLYPHKQLLRSVLTAKPSNVSDTKKLHMTKILLSRGLARRTKKCSCKQNENLGFFQYCDNVIQAASLSTKSTEIVNFLIDADLVTNLCLRKAAYSEYEEDFEISAKVRETLLKRSWEPLSLRNLSRSVFTQRIKRGRGKGARQANVRLLPLSEELKQFLLFEVSDQELSQGRQREMADLAERFRCLNFCIL